MTSASGIYRIVCVANEKAYVGSARSIRDRWRKHVRLLETGGHHNIHLQRAWDKYGVDSFRFEIVELVPVAFLLEAEQKHIDGCPAKFNICQKAGSNLGVKRSAEAKAKMSASAKRRVASPEARANMSAAAKLRTASPGERARMAAISRAQTYTAERRAKVGAAHRGMRHTEATKATIGNKNRGRVRPPRTETVRAHMSEAQSRYQAAKRAASSAGAVS